MACYQGKCYKKEELLQKVGTINQIAGVKRYEYTDGLGKGVEIAEFRTGTGLRFLVNLSRCLDIVQADFCGKTLNYKTSCEETNPLFFHPQGIEWLYTFAGGVTATCGMMNVGEVCEFGGETKVMHGRCGNLPAYDICVDCYWDEDDYIMSVSGKMRETSLFGCNYVLERTVWAKLGENKIYLEDEITNEAHLKYPLEILYHMNWGFPLVDEGSYLVVPSKSVVPRDSDAEKGVDTYDKLIAPEYNYQEQCFFHDLKEKDGFAEMALINPNLNLGISVKYNKSSLPFFTEWKCMDRGQYTLGFEPANCHVMGMKWESDNGTLEYLEPGQKKVNTIEISIFDGKEEIKKCEDRLRSL